RSYGDWSSDVCSSDLDDVIRMNGAAPDPAEAHRVCAFADRVRQRAGLQIKAEINITSNFPVAAGLASSASTFAALALAATSAARSEERRVGKEGRCRR